MSGVFAVFCRFTQLSSPTFPPSLLLSTGKYHSFCNGKMEKFNHKMSYRTICRFMSLGM